MFERLPAENFGLNYDPSHFIWQQMDYISPLYEFREKIFHVHCKDIRLDQSLSLSVEQASYVDGCSRLFCIFQKWFIAGLFGMTIPSAGTLTHRDGVWILRAICKYF